MNRRRSFFTSAACALPTAWKLPARPATAIAATPGNNDDAMAILKQTHAALFDLWFPLKELPTPASKRVETKTIADAVSAEMFEAFTSTSSGLLPLLQGLTNPAVLPFYPALKTAKNPAVRRFVAAAGGL